MPAPAPKPMALGAMAAKPVQAAKFRGWSLMRSGSTMATVDWTLGALTSTLARFLVSVMAAQEVTSAPVPEVVATEIWGMVQGFSLARGSIQGGWGWAVEVLTDVP